MGLDIVISIIILSLLIGIGIYFITQMNKPKPVEPAEVGQAVSCGKNNLKNIDGAVYRYMGDKTIRFYPNPSIASFYDKDWGSGLQRKIDCTGFTLGDDMEPGIGQAVSCGKSNLKNIDNAIYRYMGDKTIRFYPTPEIAKSWDKDFGSGIARKIDCTGFTLGADMGMNPSPPA